jgi:hypothetical protein
MRPMTSDANASTRCCRAVLSVEAVVMSPPCSPSATVVVSGR